METQQLSMFADYPTSSYSLQDFHVKLLALQETDEDLKTQEVHSFLKSHGFYKPKNQHAFYSKTLKSFLTTNPGELLQKSTEFSLTLAIPLAGKWSILATSDSHKTGSEYTLSDILIPEPPAKYYLSKKKVSGLLKGTNLPQLLELSQQEETLEDSTQT